MTADGAILRIDNFVYFIQVEGFSDQLFWYLVRVTGIISLFTIAVAIITGLLIPSRLLGIKPTIPWLTDLHRLMSSISMALILVHMISLWADNFTSFSIADLLIPFKSDFAGLKIYLTFGVIAFWFLLIVEMSSLLKKYMSKTIWHVLHLLSFPALLLSVLHGIYIGSDADNPIVLTLMAALISALVLGCFGRLIRTKSEPKI